MKPYPHIYTASAKGEASGLLPVSAASVPTIDTAPPAEFGGPGDRWSPETLLCAAVADCFILTFRAIARASKHEWLNLDCRVDGKLERIEGVSQFTHFDTHATLKIPAGSDIERAKTLLEKSERDCLIANSLHGTRALEIRIVN
jgi:organic hydroperoxide reductase OsmC/OhrA